MRLLPVAITAVVLALAGCGTAGSAAVIGPVSISDQQLQQEVQVVLQAQGRSLNSSDAELSREVLNRMVLTALVDQLAEREGVTVDQGTIDQTLIDFDAQVGGRTELEELYRQQGVAPSQIEDIIRLNALAVQLGPVLNPSGTPEAQSQALVQAVTDLSLELQTSVSPRFGSWEPMVLNIGPAIDDLSIPVES